MHTKNDIKNDIKTSWKLSALTSALVSSVGLCAALYAPSATALTLGGLSVQSHLGSALQAQIDILQITPEELEALQASIAPPEIFRAHGMEYNSSVVQGITLSVERGNPNRLLLRSSAPLAVPFLDLVIDTSWNAGNLVRSYTLLIDPPPKKPSTENNPSAAAASTPAVSAPATASVPTPATVGRSYSSAAASAPKPAPKKAPASAPTSGTGGGKAVTVKYGDTAGRLVRQNLARGVSLDQMLLALVQHNPQAFVDGNVNRLKTGAVLKMPTAEQAQATPADQARSIISAQSRDFNAYRRNLGRKAPKAQIAAAQRSAGGQVQAQVQDSSPSATPADKLTLSKANANANADVSADTAAATTAVEDKIAQEKERSAQNQRIEQLQDNVIQLQNLSDAGSATGAADTAKEGGSALAIQGQNPTDAGDISADPQAATPPVEPSAEPPENDPSPLPAPPDNTSEDASKKPWLAIGAGTLLALLLGGAGLWWYRGKRQFEKKKASVLGAAAAAAAALAEKENAEDSADKTSANDADKEAEKNSRRSEDPIDPIAEADVYLAYGKDEEALNILRSALEQHPQHAPLYAKLAEVHAKHHQLPELEAMARAVHGLTQGQGSDWEQVRSLGANLDPKNPLYALEPGASAPTASDPNSFAQALQNSQADFVPEDFAQEPQASASATANDISDISDIPDLSDLDFGQESTPAPSASSQPPSRPPSPAEIDPFDEALGLEPPEPPPSRALDFGFDNEPPAPSPRAAPAAAPVDDFGLSGLDLDGGQNELEDSFVIPDDDPLIQSAAQTSAPSAASVKPAASAPVLEPQSTQLDTMGSLDSLDIDMGNDTHSSSIDDPFAIDSNDINTDTSADNNIDPEQEGLLTKLDLAQEFASIGDSEGARSLIDEVLAEAKSGQVQARAREMLLQL